MSPVTKLRAARMAWLTMLGAATASICALYLMDQMNPVGVVILDQLGPGYRAYLVLAVCFIVTLTISIVFRRHIMAARQQMNELAAARLLEGLLADRPLDCKNFFVYLRSFETTGHLKPPFFFTLALWQRLHANELESFLALALAKDGPVVALGLPGESLGAARISTEESQWKTDIQRLLTRAAGVLVVPSDHAGTRWEIAFLQEQKLLTQAVFIMPPRAPNFDWPGKWKQAAEALRSLSIELPEYNQRGLLFTLNAAGRVADARVFSLLWRRSLRNSVRELWAGKTRANLGAGAVERANRRSRLVWLYGKWGISVSTVAVLPLLLWFGIGSILSGGAPAGVNPSPALATFEDRYDSAQEIGSGQTLLDSELLLLKHQKLPEGKVDLLAQQGLVRVDNQAREIFLLGLGEVLSHSLDERLCEALVEGSASELDRIRTLLLMPAPHIAQWMSARQYAASAMLRQRPVLIESSKPGPELQQALPTVVGGQTASALEELLLERRKLSSSQVCFLAIQGGLALYRLPEPQKTELAAHLATVLSP